MIYSYGSDNLFPIVFDPESQTLTFLDDRIHETEYFWSPVTFPQAGPLPVDNPRGVLLCSRTDHLCVDTCPEDCDEVIFDIILIRQTEDLTEVQHLATECHDYQAAFADGSSLSASETPDSSSQISVATPQESPPPVPISSTQALGAGPVPAEPNESDQVVPGQEQHPPNWVEGCQCRLCQLVAGIDP